ncbi:MAG: ABC-type sugar transport system, periplasmic component, partial [Paenibacillus sp.]|nr:ABC-type sugar transport system, periplasmic component [Paenibacillus sp.]
MKRRNKAKAVKVWTVLAVTVLAMTACSGSGDKAQPASNQVGGGSANLSIMWWGPDARHQATLKALDIYTKQRPEIK